MEGVTTPVKGLTSRLLSTSLDEGRAADKSKQSVTQWTAHDDSLNSNVEDDSDEDGQLVLNSSALIEDEGVSLESDSLKRVDFLTALPFEVSVYILLFADVPSLCLAKQVSRAWRLICSDGLVWRDHFYRQPGWKIRPEILQAAAHLQDMSTAESDALARRSSRTSPGLLSPRASISQQVDDTIAFPWASPTRDYTFGSPTFARNPSAYFGSMASPVSPNSSTSSSQQQQQQQSAPSMTSRFGITRRLSTLSTLMSDFSGSFHRPPALTTISSRHPQSNRARTRTQSSGGQSGTSSHTNTQPRRTPFLSPSGPVQSPFHTSTTSPVRLAPLQGLDWAELYKNRYLLEMRWLDGTQYTSVLRGHQDSVYCVQADREKLISGSRDTTAKIWDLQTGVCKQTLIGHRGSILTLQFDDQTLMTGSSDATIIIWDLTTYKRTQTLRGHTLGVLDLCFDHQYIVSCSKDLTIRVWQRNDGTLYRVLSGHRGPVNAARLQGNRIVSASGDSLMKLWNIETGEIIRVFAGHERGLACLDWSGDRVATGSNDRTIRVWDVHTGACLAIMEGHGDLVRTLVLDGPSNRVISGSYDRTVRIWDANNGDQLVEFRKGHKSLVFDVTTDVSRIFSCSHDERILILDFGKGLDIEPFE